MKTKIIIRPPKNKQERLEIEQLKKTAQEKSNPHCIKTKNLTLVADVKIPEQEIEVLINQIDEIVKTEPATQTQRKDGAYCIKGKYFAVVNSQEIPAQNAEDAQGILRRGHAFTCPKNNKKTGDV